MFYAAQNSFHESLLFFLCKSVNLLLLFINLKLALDWPKEVVVVVVVVVTCLFVYVYEFVCMRFVRNALSSCGSFVARICSL